MAARRLLVSGLVQGVGFRDALRRQALRLGLSGWVRNRGDGTVEAVAVGDDAALDALKRWAQRGPAAARVDAVEATALSATALSEILPPVGEGFRQVPTTRD